MQRRTFLTLAASAALATQLPRWAISATLRQRDLFALGVASGAPTPDGFVLWTRLFDGAIPGTPQADAHGTTPLQGRLTVQWEVAEDEAFRRIVRRGHAQALPELGHSVHVEVDGLRPDRWYFYRFMHGDAVTAPSRTRTAPAADTLAPRVRFAFASCQRWEQGYYAAYRRMRQEDLDLVVFLGDYIYETAVPANARAHLPRTHSLPTATSLQDFRDRYALYKSDPLLRAMHAACPWLVTWDDHEVQNDYAALAGSEPAAAFLARRTAGYQAFYENMPIRASTLVHGAAGLGTPDALRIHTRHRWGRLVDFHVLDDRQYRDIQPCREPGQPRKGAVSPETCSALYDSRRTMLGSAQERWLAQGLTQDQRDQTRWSAIAQQTIFSRRNYKAPPEEAFHSDTWDGYPAARQRLLDSIAAAAPRNSVFIGGDIHQHYACNVLADFSDPSSRVIASEFCTTSIASASGSSMQSVENIMAQNPHIVHARPDRRGYTVVEATPARWAATLRAVEDVTRADSPVGTQAAFVVEDRRPGVQRATGG
ncbi:alkaline phosphatase [Cupriavidus sp. amp6]|uniref:alkaline phosphatase D family protein n=1 Tax=Cupriavidus sp. amp6 TaxID=388051 RepID=UPI00040FA5F5|nr:alkaline phosphatase D family protein [Cupriavidus sp. amp6]